MCIADQGKEECERKQQRCSATCIYESIVCHVRPPDKDGHIPHWSYKRYYLKKFPPANDTLAWYRIQDDLRRYLKEQFANLKNASAAMCAGKFQQGDFDQALQDLGKFQKIPHAQWHDVCKQYFEGEKLKECRTSDGFTNSSGIFIHVKTPVTSEAGMIDYTDTLIHEAIHAIFESRRERQHKTVSAQDKECEERLIESYLDRHPIVPIDCQ